MKPPTSVVWFVTAENESIVVQSVHLLKLLDFLISSWTLTTKVQNVQTIIIKIVIIFVRMMMLTILISKL